MFLLNFKHRGLKFQLNSTQTIISTNLFQIRSIYAHLRTQIPCKTDLIPPSIQQKEHIFSVIKKLYKKDVQMTCFKENLGETFRNISFHSS